MDITVRPSSIYDSHAHYNDERFGNAAEFLKQLNNEMGVGAVINCAVDIPSAKQCAELSKALDFCHTAAGFHAGDIPDGDIASHIAELEQFIKENKVIAVGEIGLDYYWDDSNKERQLIFFEEQLKLANRLSLPVIVHDRDAHADTLELLKKYNPKGVVHCFSGSVEMAKEVIKLGMYIGVGGVVTFKNAKKLVEVVRETPISKILLETDAPYMAPEPNRGKTCHSGYIAYTAKKIAEIKDMNIQDVIDICANNTRELFNIK